MQAYRAWHRVSVKQRTAAHQRRFQLRVPPTLIEASWENSLIQRNIISHAALRFWYTEYSIETGVNIRDPEAGNGEPMWWGGILNAQSGNGELSLGSSSSTNLLGRVLGEKIGLDELSAAKGWNWRLMLAKLFSTPTTVGSSADGSTFGFLGSLSTIAFRARFCFRLTSKDFWRDPHQHRTVYRKSLYLHRLYASCNHRFTWPVEHLYQTFWRCGRLGFVLGRYSIIAA